MFDLKSKLIKLGSRNPDLQDNLYQVISKIEDNKFDPEKPIPKDYDEEYVRDLNDYLTSKLREATKSSNHWYETGIDKFIDASYAGPFAYGLYDSPMNVENPAFWERELKKGEVRISFYIDPKRYSSMIDEGEIWAGIDGYYVPPVRGVGNELDFEGSKQTPQKALRWVSKFVPKLNIEL